MDGLTYEYRMIVVESMPEFETRLNTLGAKGWDLVGFTHQVLGDDYHYYRGALKRVVGGTFSAAKIENINLATGANPSRRQVETIREIVTSSGKQVVPVQTLKMSGVVENLEEIE